MTTKTIYDYENDSVSFDGGSGLHPVRIAKTPDGALRIDPKRSILNKEEASLLIEHCQRFVDGNPLCPPLAKPPRRFYHDDPETGDRLWAVFYRDGCVWLSDPDKWHANYYMAFEGETCIETDDGIARGAVSLKVTFIDEE